MESFFGKPLNRIDAPLKVTGRAPYSFEHQVSSAAYAVLIMSTIARDRIAAMDTRLAATHRVLCWFLHT